MFYWFRKKETIIIHTHTIPSALTYAAPLLETCNLWEFNWQALSLRLLHNTRQLEHTFSCGNGFYRWIAGWLKWKKPKTIIAFWMDQMHFVLLYMRNGRAQWLYGVWMNVNGFVYAHHSDSELNVLMFLMHWSEASIVLWISR